MAVQRLEDKIKGISIINPDEVERNYYLYCIDYAIKNGFNHIQITGPIHDHVKGNIDGMTFNRKYSQFNDEKNADYINMCMEVVNEGLEISNKAGIKTFMWHHELDLPANFGKIFSDVLNENGDIEVSHPLVADYLENKILDFFYAYPKMDGIILTLHETKIPLLKLKNQKLDKIARVKHVVKILYDTCERLGKELIVRPFASLAKDQTLMLQAFAEISDKLIVMDKWTKYDWSLSLPDNDFFEEITQNPFIVEGDVFGEYFGKGRLPIMFQEHIEHKYAHCNKYPNSGFVARIDRNYQNPFGSVNEVNLVVNHAVLNNLDVAEQVKKFFADKYGTYGAVVQKIMEQTEANQKKIFYLNGYYYTQGSYFPEVNHAKNHFFFEIMREDYAIASNEWFIPIGWQRGAIDYLLQEKSEAVVEAENLLKEVLTLEGKLDKAEYEDLYVKFKNLDYVAKIWNEMTLVYYNYIKYFETLDDKFEKKLFLHLDNIDELHSKGRAELGEAFYNYLGARGFTNAIPEFGGDFVACLKANYKYEKQVRAVLSKENLLDYVVCGTAYEGHKIQKEVNFADTYFVGEDVCRIPGNKSAKWSTINAHGWFSYEMKTNADKDTQFTFLLGSSNDNLNVQITIGSDVHVIDKKITGKEEFSFIYPASGKDNVRVRIDRINANTPFVYIIKTK